MCQGPGIGSIKDLKVVTVVAGTEREYHSRSHKRETMQSHEGS